MKWLSDTSNKHCIYKYFKQRENYCNVDDVKMMEYNWNYEAKLIENNCNDDAKTDGK